MVNVTFPRLAALAIAAAYLAGGAAAGLGPDLLQLLAALIWPLAFIWFPEVLASFSGYAGRGGFAKPVPPSLISGAGWFLLVGLPVLLFLVPGMVDRLVDHVDDAQESDEFQEAMQAEIRWLDKRLADVSPARFQQLTRIFRDATRLEIDFWEMGLKLSD